MYTPAIHIERPIRYAATITALLCASALSSLGWIFEGEAVKRLDPLSITCVSLVVSGVILLGFARVRGTPPPAALKQVVTPNFLLFSLMRGTVVGLLFCYCLTLTTSTKTMFLTKIEPYIVLLIQIVWFGHRTTLQHLALLALHIFGAVLLSTGGVLALSVDTLGDLLILVAVTVNAGLYNPTHRYASLLGSSYAAGFSHLVGGIMLIPFIPFYSLESFTLAGDHLVGWYYVFLTVLVFYVLSTGLWFAAMPKVPPWLASALRSFGPVFAAPIAWLYFDRSITKLQGLGAGLVILTSAWMVVLERREV